jgi:hypothetical protein
LTDVVKGTKSLRRGGVEFLDQPVKGVLEAPLVLIGSISDKVDDLAVVIRSLLIVAAVLVDHP